MSQGRQLSALVLGGANCLDDEKAQDRFCVYEHWRTDTNQCFYVGKGTTERALSTRQRNRIHCAIRDRLESSGLRVEIRIVSSRMTERAAHMLEIQLIRRYGKIYDGTGTLANFTNGGEGLSGYSHPPEVRERIRHKLIGQKRTPEQIERIRRSQIGKVASQELRQKRSVNAMGHPHYSKSPEGLERCGAANRGKKLSAERRALISSQLSERECKPETRKKHSERMKGNKQFLGRKHSPETIARMSIANKAAWERRRGRQS